MSPVPDENDRKHVLKFFFSFLFHFIAGENVPHSDSGFLLVIIFVTDGGKTALSYSTYQWSHASKTS